MTQSNLHMVWIGFVVFLEVATNFQDNFVHTLLAFSIMFGGTK